MQNNSLIFFGKCVALLSKLLNLGNGSTWPGHIALQRNKNFIKDILHNSEVKIIVVVGTNGKTTTAKMITTILKEAKMRVFQNNTGANLLNGIASSLLLHTNVWGNIPYDYAVFEIDENVLPLFLKEVIPDAIVLLNLFRDQLDRYGEIDTIAKKWKSIIEALPENAELFLNADDPQIAFLGENIQAKVHYFGLEEKSEHKTLEHASDSIYCPKCNTKLTYKKIYYSHLGVWHCSHCTFKRPAPAMTTTYFPLAGTYNRYNTLAASLFAQKQNIPANVIEKALKKVQPAFGRQEKLKIDGKNIQIFLSKNPTSFNQSLATIASTFPSPTRREIKSEVSGYKNILFVLNDRIPDGKDISWIWDIDLEDHLGEFKNIAISGDRAYDMALRLQYAAERSKVSGQARMTNLVTVYENLEEAINKSLSEINSNETLYILPTYSAMLEVRQVLTGKKIL